MLLRHAFAVGMFLVKTDFYLHQGVMGMWYIGQFCRFALYMFFMLYLSPIGNAAAYVFNLKVDLIFLPSYCLSVVVLLLVFLQVS